MKNVSNGFRKLDASEIAFVAGGGDGPIVVEGKRDKRPEPEPFIVVSAGSGGINNGGGGSGGFTLPGVIITDFDLNDLNDEDFRIPPSEPDNSTPPENSPVDVSGDGFDNNAPDPTSLPSFNTVEIIRGLGIGVTGSVTDPQGPAITTTFRFR